MRVDRPTIEPRFTPPRAERPHSASWVRSPIVIAVVICLLTGAILFLSWHDARFVLSVSPIAAPSQSDCVSILARELGGNDWDSQCRNGLTHRSWFSASVTNVGHSSGYLVCSLIALDAPGNVLYSVSPGPGPIGAIAGPLVEPGQTYAWKYYSPPFHGHVARYVGNCAATDNPAI